LNCFTYLTADGTTPFCLVQYSISSLTCWYK